ncbi:uncharacterized protein LOC143880249 isoform X2 [Tasmannia lanceolata]|uniref:uncharacterized protein LOC143880249 isoform X2 n=1 Tax=Tasmannia lanceolata TaxID=3420 RepID=UPI004062FAE1
MPSKPLPLDRKDFFKEKKHERSDALVPFSRWRDGYNGSRCFVRGGSDDLRRPSGPAKPGNYQGFPEDSGASHTEGRYGRNSRETKGSFSSQKDWKGYQHQHHHSWEAGDALTSSRRQHDVSFQRSVDDLLTHNSHPSSDIENSSCDQLHLKDQHDKMGSVDGLGTGLIYGKDHLLGSIAWKSLKWTRSGSLPSRTSGFSYSTSSKSIRADSDDIRVELMPRKLTPARSPSGDPVRGLTTDAQFEDTCPQKKQRLGWGQGLAKYEKEKVEGSEENMSKSALVQCTNSIKSVQNTSSATLFNRSPKINGVMECTSPTIPCSVACSSSPGVEDKRYFKVSNNDIDMNHLIPSPGQGFPNHPKEFPVNLEQLEGPINNISSRLADLLQTEDASSGDSNFVRYTDLNKLMLIKNDILKALEKTEFEVDLFENELKSLQSESETNGTCPTTSSFLSADSAPKPCKEQPDSAVQPIMVEPILCNDPSEVPTERKSADIDSPGTFASNCGELIPVEKGLFSSDFVKLAQHSADFDSSGSITPGRQCFSPLVDRIESADLCGEVGATFLNKSCTGAKRNCVEADCTLTASVLASNKDSARKATEIFDKLLPSDLPQFDIWRPKESVLYSQNNFQIRKMLGMRNSVQKFRERVLTLKFRVLHHMWKEDLRLLSLRKYRAKSQKQFGLSCRSSQNGYQKNCSSVWSRFTSPGNLTLVPTTEIIDFPSKLLSDTQVKLYRNSLKMPALITDEQERRYSRFITGNGLVEDPCLAEKERVMINRWTPKEKEIFMDMLATYGKDFVKVASFLNHKTTADCVEFYYKTHKSESFEKIRKRLELRKQGRCFRANTYLVTSGKKRNREGNASSLNMLGEASVVAAPTDACAKTQQTYAGGSILGGYYECKMARGNDGILEMTSSTNISMNGSEVMSSCITISVDPGEGFQEWRGQKRNYMIMDRPFTPELSGNIDEEDACSDESCGELDCVDWTDQEKSSFIIALRSYGRDFASISRCVGTKSMVQCKIFFSKARKSLGLDVIHPGLDNEGTPMSDSNGGRSDTDDACVVEMDSAICSTQSCSKIDVDLTEPLVDRSNEGYGNVGNNLLQIELGRSSGKDDTGGSNLREVGNVLEKLVSDDSLAGTERASTFDSENTLPKGDGLLGVNLTLKLHEGVDMFVDAEATERGICKAVTPACTVPREGETFLRRSRSHVAELKQEAGPCECDMERETESEPKHSVVLESDLDRGDGKTSSDANNCGSSMPLSSGNRNSLLSGVQVNARPGLDDRNGKTSLDAKNCSSSCCFVPHSSGTINPLVPRVHVNAQPVFSFIPNNHHQIPQDLLSCKQKSHIISWPQKENCPELGNSVAPGIHLYEDLRRTRHSTLNFEHWDKHHQKYIGTDFYQQYLLGCQSLNRANQSLQILTGYPLEVLNKKEMNVDADLKHVVSHNLSGFNRNSQSTQDMHLEKCNGSKLLHSVSEISFLPKSNGQTNDQLRPCSRGLEKQGRSNSEIEEQSVRAGDFKLFGKTVSHLSGLQKTSSPQENNDKLGSPRSNKSFSLNFSERRTDKNFITSKIESSRDEFSMTSYGFWDGNRIQTGLSSLPDSARLSAKHSAVTSDYAAALCRMRNDQSLGSLSVFPTKNVSSNCGLADYQVCRSYEGVKMLDMKREEIFSELKKRNGFETVLGFQQPRRGVVGGGGVCNGVSDPVAAIKLHYATEKHLGGAPSGIIREDIGR